MNELELYSQINAYKAKIAELERQIAVQNEEINELEDFRLSIRGMINRMNDSRTHTEHILTRTRALINGPLALIQPLISINRGSRHTNAIDGLMEAVAKILRERNKKESEIDDLRDRIAYYQELIRQMQEQIRVLAAEGQ